jgi:hypothetical protein
VEYQHEIKKTKIFPKKDLLFSKFSAIISKRSFGRSMNVSFRIGGAVNGEV